MKSKIMYNIDYILEIPNAIESDFCKKIITDRLADSLDPYEDVVCWKNKNIYTNWVYLFDILDKKAKKNIEIYFDQFVDTLKYNDIYLEGFGISRQKSGDYDRYHYDTNIVVENNSIKIRPFVFLIYLNENFKGGQLIFPSQKKIVEPKEGKIIIFPCSYMYPHKVASISEGDRFSLRLNYYLKKSDTDSDLDYWDNSKLGIQK